MDPTRTQRRREPTKATPPDGSVGTSRRILELVFGPPAERTFAVEFWNGEVDEPGRGTEFTLRMRWPGALRRMLLPPTDRSVGEAYIRGDIEIEGDLEAAVRAGWQRIESMKAPRRAARLLLELLRLPGRDAGRPRTALLRLPGRDATRRRQWAGRPGAPEPSGRAGPLEPRPYPPVALVPLGRRWRDAQAVRFHYDLGNDFFALFLDPRMQYSCAYFDRSGMSLEEAQEAKLDLICRKLRLRSGERFLDIGCGWGGLVVHAAERYGVRATGITLSERQAEWARRAVAAAGLEDRCTIELVDYRDLVGSGRFDKIASVGMIEHVGLRRYGVYFGAAYRLLRPGGLFLNHGIVLRRGHTAADRVRLRAGRAGSFIHRYIFPQTDLVPIGRTLGEAERAGFEVRDVENLREHYTLTLREWLRRLEERRDEAVASVGEATWRAWRFYLGACVHAFDCGYTGIVQALLARRAPDGSVDVPATRLDVYAT